MYFVDCRRRLGFSFLTFVIGLLFVVSITPGAVNSSANSASRTKKQTKRSFSSIVDSQIFDQFDTWIKSYINNGYRADDQQMRFGEDLAVKRRQLLKELIQLDPKAALEKAIPAGIFDGLPSFITEQSEKRISANADFLVSASDEIKHSSGETSGSPTERAVIVGDSRYKAFAYGRRTSMTTKLDIPLQGIVVEDLMAVDESPERIIDSTEFAGRGVDKSALSEDTIPAEVGGKVVYFSNQSELDNFVGEQVAWESKIGPVRPKENSAKGSLAPEETASTWTTGPKKILFIRVDFPDRLEVDPIDYNGLPLTQARAESIYSEVNQFYLSNSYGKTSLQTTVTPVVHMPHPQTYYTQLNNDVEMENDARNEAFLQKGYDTNKFDFDVVGFSYTTGFNWSGHSLIGTKGSLLNGVFSLPVAAHELGHNYGLLHANLWQTTDGTPNGAGNDVEYGDCYDMMSDPTTCSISSNSHFNVRYKRLLDWLTDADVETATANGEYTIYAQDSASSAPGFRALKITKDATKNYWIEFRQLAGGNASNGALIHWDYASQDFNQTQLLDMHPATSTIADAPLQIGQSFTDSDSGNGSIIKITVLRKGNTAPESLVVNVEFSKPVCTYSLSSTGDNFSAGGGAGSVDVTAASSCSDLTAASNASWISVTGIDNINGKRKVSYSVMSNLGAKRSGTITIGDKTFTVTQAVGNCNYSSIPTNFIISASGGTFDYMSNVTFGCVLTPTTDADWIDISSNNPIRVLANTGGAARSGTVNLTGSDNNQQPVQITLTVNQSSGSSCTYSLIASSRSFNASGGQGTFTIQPSDAACPVDYAASSNDSWIIGASGSSPLNKSFTVAANPGVSSRTGTITVNSSSAGSQILTITQSSGGCVYNLSSSGTTISFGGETGSFSINSGNGCGWTAATNDSWITISNNSGSGSGTIGFSAVLNTGVTRSGTITAGGQTFNITQVGYVRRKKLLLSPPSASTNSSTTALSSR